MISIRPVQAQELDTVWALVRRAVVHMNELGNPQWGEDYPTRDFYAGDLDRGELYAPRPAMVIHRMAIDPVFQRQGVATALFAFAEEKARGQGITAMRIDTYSLNDRMQALIRKRGFSKVGEIHLHGRPLTYPCFEKSLAF